MCIRDRSDVDLWGECVARCLTMAGLTEEDIIHVCYGYGLFTGGMGLDFGTRKLGAMAIPMSAGNTKRQMMCMEAVSYTHLIWKSSRSAITSLWWTARNTARFEAMKT